MRSRTAAACSNSSPSAACSISAASSCCTVADLPARNAFAWPTRPAVVRLADPPDAGRRAAADLVQQAGPGAVGEHRVGAGAQQEHPLHRGDRLVHRPGGGERPPVAALAQLRAAMLGDLRERVVLGQHQPGVRLVVPQDDVEARLQALDQVGLEQQRLGLGVGGDHLHRGGLVAPSAAAARPAGRPGYRRRPASSGCAPCRHRAHRPWHRACDRRRG